jgi:membrane-bound metal-dependent hydrolase YbcI (DUF457 family)
MNLFTWLFLGHCVGDWMLQNDWMATNKQNGFVNRACFVHVTIYTLCIGVSLWLAQAPAVSFRSVMLFGAAVYVSHWLIDVTNAAGLWARFIQQSDNALVRIMVDQTFHLLVLGLLIALVFES